MVIPYFTAHYSCYDSTSKCSIIWGCNSTSRRPIDHQGGLCISIGRYGLQCSYWWHSEGSQGTEKGWQRSNHDYVGQRSSYKPPYKVRMHPFLLSHPVGHTTDKLIGRREKRPSSPLTPKLTNVCTMKAYQRYQSCKRRRSRESYWRIANCPYDMTL